MSENKFNDRSIVNSDIVALRISIINKWVMKENCHEHFLNFSHLFSILGRSGKWRREMSHHVKVIHDLNTIYFKMPPYFKIFFLYLNVATTKNV
jgi:hypothetical protein